MGKTAVSIPESDTPGVCDLCGAREGEENLKYCWQDHELTDDLKAEGVSASVSAVKACEKCREARADLSGGIQEISLRRDPGFTLTRIGNGFIVSAITGFPLHHDDIDRSRPKCRVLGEAIGYYATREFVPHETMMEWMKIMRANLKVAAF